MVVFGNGVKVAYPARAMFDALFTVTCLSAQLGYDIYVTSWQDKVHGQNSLHPRGLAIDFGVEGNDRPRLEAIFSWLTRLLSAEYDVVYEGDHVHVEYDVHRAVKDAPAPTPAPIT